MVSRRLTTLTAVLGLLTSLLVMTPTLPAFASSSAESDLVSRINAERARRGLGGLSVSGDLVSVARDNSAKMARNGQLSHTSNLGGRVGGWEKVAENVGYGGSAKAVHSAFMSSGSHSGNILDPAFTQVGVGVVVDGDGTLWVTQVFRQPKGASSPPAPEPEPEPAPAPKPKASTRASSGGSSSGGSSSGGSSGGGSASTPPPPPPAPEPEPEPEPLEPSFDRITVTLARIEATDEGSEAKVDAILVPED
ncbi:MAG: CAP domain-containing protein [Actinomycetes bacterium]